MIGNGKFEPFTDWNDIELRYRITVDLLDIKYLRKNEKGQKNF